MTRNEWNSRLDEACQVQGIDRVEAEILGTLHNEGELSNTVLEGAMSWSGATADDVRSRVATLRARNLVHVGNGRVAVTPLGQQALREIGRTMMGQAADAVDVEVRFSRGILNFRGPSAVAILHRMTAEAGNLDFTLWAPIVMRREAQTGTITCRVAAKKRQSRSDEGFLLDQILTYMNQEQRQPGSVVQIEEAG